MTTLSKEQLQVLQHSVGADQYGRGGGHRNFFGTMRDGRDGKICDSLVELGFMCRTGPVAFYGGEHVYSVTASGVIAMRQQSPNAPKLTRSQGRYQKWLGLDSGLSFREWLGIKNRRRAVSA